MSDEPKVAVGYVRRSDKSDSSIESQIRDIHEYAEENGYEVDQVYNEGNRVSGWDDAREQYNEMRAAAKREEFDAVIARDGTRLGRDERERMRLWLDLAEWGIELHTKRRGYIDPDEPFSMVQEAFHASQSDHAKREEIEKAQAEIQLRVENGWWHGGLPKGTEYTADKRGLARGAEYETVMNIISAKEDGETHAEVSDEYGVATGTVTNILSRRAMYEYLRNHDEWRPAYTDSIGEIEQ
ncbi:recombinase family protein [Halorarum halophilum]|uniref:Recombinase family protein n=1 Tax=Halorarum halophilum TaxID=2743090 RepID=A0A7D5GFE6_9EURY|nr:recombinase family protein [Halobaculum halophilum]QLG28168.1 recombinase family protein [Halobaculum halophilum]